VSNSGLLDDKNLRAKKVEWLNRHDKESGDLFGSLPLVQGMAVCLTDHVDRSTKALLRGTSGILVGWELDPREPTPPIDTDHHLLHHPKAIYVKFETEINGVNMTPDWNIAGMENGIYCITPATKPWKLKLSKKNVVHISRRQLPIAPDYARTAYSMQGFNLRSCKIDLNLGGMDPVTGYVAATRFKRADDVIILQPFDIKIFQKGAPDQPQLLMRHLAGEDISDGLAALHKKIKEQTAAQQQQKKQRANQNRSETQKRNWEGMTAEERQRRAPKPQKQQRANENRSEKQKRSWEGMTTEERQRRAPKPRQDQGSTETVVCGTCGKHKPRGPDGDRVYTNDEWYKATKKGKPAQCRQCTKYFTCSQCEVSKDRHAYTERKWRKRHKEYITCKACALST
jgi:hypothetical protein